MGMNIYPTKAAGIANLDDSSACVDKPLFAFSVALLDDSVEIVYGVRLILNRQRAGRSSVGRPFLSANLAYSFPVRGPASRAPSTVFFWRARGKAKSLVPTGWGVPRSCFAAPRAIPNSNLPASWISVSPTLRARFARQFIFNLVVGQAVPNALRGFRYLLSITSVHARHDLTREQIHREYAEHGDGFEDDLREMADGQN
jgi:hypothetical protein